MKTTSIKAYKEIKKSGYLTRKQQDVLNYIHTFGPCTAREVSKHIIGAWKRCSELEAMGCINGTETTKCATSHKTVSVYKWITNTPRPKAIKEEPEETGFIPFSLFQKAYSLGYSAAMRNINGF